MKKVKLMLVGLAVLILLNPAFAEIQVVYNVEVGTNNVVLVPTLQNYEAKASEWTNTTYTAGAYISNTNTTPTMYYWTPDGGASTNAPTHTSGLVEQANGIEWYRLQKYNRENGVEITLIDSGDVYISRSDAAATAEGSLMTGKGAMRDFVRLRANEKPYRGEINAISASGTITTGVQIY